MTINDGSFMQLCNKNTKSLHSCPGALSFDKFSEQFCFNKVNFASDHEMIPSYFTNKREEVLETGLFMKVIRYQRHRLFKRYKNFVFKLMYVKIVSGTKN